MSSASNIVFIDADVPDLQDLLGGLASGVTAFVIDPASDGLAQIAAILAANDLTGLSSISIVGHGASGEIQLGATLLDDADLSSESTALAQIGAALAPGGAMQLFACDVAGGAAGQTFIADLSGFAGGAEVAAATHLVGSADLGGSWTLDASTGPSASSAPFTQAALASFQGELDVHTPPTVTAGATATFDGGGADVALDPGLTISDSDSGGNLTGAQVIMFGGIAGDTLTIGGKTSGTYAHITYSFSGNTLTLSGTDSIADYQAALRLVSYGFSPANGDPTAAGTATSRSFAWIVNDGSPTNGTNVQGSAPTPIANDQPALGLNQLLVTEGIFPGRDTTVSDPAGIPMGSIRTFAGSFAPGNTAVATGQTIPISANDPLFSILGTSYGGNGTSNFALPNLGGELAVGAESNSVGGKSGADQVTLTGQNMPADVGGGGQPFNNDQPSLQINYLINVGGNAPGAGSDDMLGEIVPFAGDFAPTGYMFANGQQLSTAEFPGLFAVLGTTYGGDGVNTFNLPDLTDKTIVGASAQNPLGTIIGQDQTTITDANAFSATPIDNHQPSLALSYIIATQGVFPSSGSAIPTNQPVLGEIVAFAGGAIPQGWALANGALLQINQNQPLFSVIGNTYGGNGQTNFALPDLRDRSVAGVGTDTGGKTITLGEQYGNATISLTAGNLPGASSTLGVVHVAPTFYASNNNFLLFYSAGQSLRISPEFVVTDPDSGGLLAGASVALPSAEIGIATLGIGGSTSGTINNIGGTISYAFNGQTLTLTGADTIADYQTALESVTFSASSISPSQEVDVSFSVNDGNPTNGNGIVESGFSNAVRIFGVEGPEIDFDPARTFIGGGPPILIDPSVTLTDPSSSTLTSVTASLFTPAPGEQETLSIAGTASGTLDSGAISYSFDAANQTLTLTGTDSLAAYQNALRQITFSDGGLVPTETTGVFWQVADPFGDEVVASAITMVHTPPTFTAGASATFTGGGSPVTLDSGVAVTDSDSGGNLTGATVSIGAGYVFGDTLNFTNTAAISGSYDSNLGILTLTGTDTFADYQAALDSITYGFNPTNGDPTGGGTGTTRTIDWVVDDGADGNNTSAAATSTLDVVHAAPTVTAGANVTYEIGRSTPVPLDPGLTVSDVDSGGNLVGATIELAPGSFVAADTLTFTNTATITGSYSSATGVLTLSGSDTLADYRAALDSVEFGTTDPQGNRVLDIGWTISDGSTSNGTSRLAESHVNTEPGPTVTAGTTVTFTGGGPAVRLDGNLNINDPASQTLDGATVAIAGAISGDTLTIGGATSGTFDNGAITFAFSGSTLTLAGTDSLGEYRLALDQVTYVFTPANGDPTGGSGDARRTIDWTVDDGVESATATSTLDLVHAPPTLAGVAATVTLDPHGTVTLSAAVTVSDPDSLSLASATVAVTGGALRGDMLAANTASTAITASYNSTTEKLVLSGSDTLANYQQVLDSVTFTTTSPDPTAGGADHTRTVTWTLNDGVAAGTPQTETVSVLTVPSLTVAASATFAAGDAAVTLSPAVALGDFNSPSLLTWTTEGSSTLASSDGAADLVGGKVYEFGATGMASGQVDIYNPATDSWSSISVAGLSTTGNPGTTVDAQGRIYLVNGSSSTERYDPSNGSVTQLAAMPGAFSSVAAATGADGRIYVFGGSDSNTTSTTNAQVYDPTTNTWSAIAAIPVGVTRGSAVVDGTLIYLIPGLMFQTQGIVQVYDTVNNTWSQVAPELHRVTDPVAGLVDGNIVVAGGGSATQIYDPTTNTWTSGPGLPTATSFADRGLISDGTQLFVVGGLDGGAPIDVVQHLGPVPSLVSATVAITGGTFAGDGDVLSVNGQTGGVINIGGANTIALSYDSAGETLTLTGSDTLADYQQALEAITFTSTNLDPTNAGADPTRTITWTVNDGIEASVPRTQTLTIESGVTLGVAPNASFVARATAVTLSPAVTLSDFNPPPLGWTTEGSSSLASSDGAADLVGGKVYEFGANGMPSGQVDIYDPTTDSWSSISVAGLSTTSSPGTTVDAQGRIYLVNGSSSTERYDPSNGSVTQLAAMPGAFSSVAAATGADGRIYVFGGSDSNTTSTTNAQVYDPTTNTWSAIAAIPVGVTRGSAVVDGTLIYLIPGLMFQTQGIVQVYDTVNNTWSQVAPELHRVTDPVAGLVDGNIVVAGGGSATQIYDPTTNTWTSGPGLPTATSFADRGLISDGTQLFVVGGLDGGAPIDVVQHLGPVPSLVSATVAITGGTFAGDGDLLVATTTGTSITASYNTATETLTLTGSDTLADYQQVLESVTFTSTDLDPTDSGADPTRTITWTVNDGSASNATASASSTISITVLTPTLSGVAASATYAAGRAPVTVSPSVALSDPTPGTLTWTTGRSSPPVLSGGAADLVNGQLFQIDGFSANLPGPHAQILIYDPTTNTWRTNANSDLVAREFLASTVDAEGRIYLIGGAVSDDGGVTPTSEVTRYDPSTDTIVQVASLPFQLESAAAATGPDGRIYVFGGDKNPAAGEIINGAEVYDPSTDTWSAIATMPVPVAGAAAVADGTLIYVIGTSSSTETDTVQVYDTVNDTWSSAAPLPTAVTGPVAGLIDGKIVVAGGGAGGPDPVNLTQIYDPATNTWTAGPALPTAALFADQGMISDGQQLFVVGGQGDNNSSITSVQLLTDVKELASATVAITGGTFAGDGDRLVANTTGTSIRADYNATTEALTLIGSDTLADYQQVLQSVTFQSTSLNPTDFGQDPTRTLTWTVNNGGAASAPQTETVTVETGPTLGVTASASFTEGIVRTTLSPTVTLSDSNPGPLTATVEGSSALLAFGAAADLVGGKLYAIDGSRGSGALAQILVYDPTTKSWSTDSQSDLIARELPASAVDAQGRIYVIGGFSSGQTAEVTRFDPSSNTVTQVASLPVAVAVAAAAGGADGRIYVFGGETASGTATSSAEAYDPGSDSWITIASLPTAVSGAVAVADGTLIYVIGGLGNSNAVVNTVQVYDTVHNTWSQAASLPTAVESAVAGLVDGNIVVAGGTNDLQNIDATQIYDPVTNTWTSGPALPTATQASGQGLVSDGHQLFVVGGQDDGGNNITSLQQLADVPTLASATVAITGGSFAGDGDFLSVNGQTRGVVGPANAIAVSYNTASETLTLTGSDTLADYRQVLATVTFQSTSVNPTDFGQDPIRTVTWTVNDGSTAGFSTTTATSTINITAVNNRPTLTGVAASPSFREEGGAVPLSTSVTVSDPDDLDLKSATVSITAGGFTGDVLAATSTTSISVSYDSTSERLILSGTDTLADYQSVLDSVTFNAGENPTDFGADPTRIITWTVQDPSGTAFGGSDTSSASTTTLSVINVNDPPTLTGVATSASFTEESGGKVLSPSVTVTDADDLDLKGATVSITAGGFAGDVLAAVPTGNITVSYNSTTETLTLSGTDTLAHYQSVLDSVTFNAGENPTGFGADPTRTITWTVQDPSGTAFGGVDTSSASTTTLSVINVNDPPTLTGVATSASFTEESGGTVLSSAVTVTDADDHDLTSATVSITAGGFTGDVLSATSTTSISVSYDSTHERLILTGSDTLAHYQSVLDTVTFNAGENPTDFGADLTRTITWVAQDPSGTANGGSDTSSASTTTLSVINVNDPPTLSSVAVSEILHVNHSIVVSPNLSVSDPDNLTLAGATVSIAGGFAGDGDLLGATTRGSISASYNSTSETLMLSGSDTLADYTSVLDSVTFSSGPNQSNGGANPTRTITWTVNDGSGSNNTASAATTVNVSSAKNDFNGDLTSDIAFQDTTAPSIGGSRGGGTTDPTAGDAQIFVINNGAMTSKKTLTAPATNAWRIVGSADFNGDGNSDIVWQNTSTNAPIIWTMNGTTYTNATTLASPGASWSAVATGDFNGDGNPDLLFQNTSTGAAEIWTMNGVSVTSMTTLAGPGSTWHVAATGDFNGDGKSDILFQNSDGTPEVWLMNGTSVTTAATLNNPGSTWHIVATADFNQDGDADILFQNTSTGAPMIWTMNGTSVTSQTTVGNPGAATGLALIGAGEYNGNGQPELLFQNTGTGAPVIWTMSGTSVTGSTTLANPGGSNWHANTG